MKKCFKTIAIILCLFLIIEICFPTLNSVKAVIEGNTDTMLIASGVTIKDKSQKLLQPQFLEEQQILSIRLDMKIYYMLKQTKMEL